MMKIKLFSNEDINSIICSYLSDYTSICYFLIYTRFRVRKYVGALIGYQHLILSPFSLFVHRKDPFKMTELTRLILESGKLYMLMNIQLNEASKFAFGCHGIECDNSEIWKHGYALTHAGEQRDCIWVYLAQIRLGNSVMIRNFKPFVRDTLFAFTRGDLFGYADLITEDTRVLAHLFKSENPIFDGRYKIFDSLDGIKDFKTDPIKFAGLLRLMGRGDFVKIYNAEFPIGLISWSWLEYMGDFDPLELYEAGKSVHNHRLCVYLEYLYKLDPTNDYHTDNPNQTVKYFSATGYHEDMSVFDFAVMLQSVDIESLKILIEENDWLFKQLLTLHVVKLRPDLLKKSTSIFCKSVIPLITERDKTYGFFQRYVL